MRNLSKTMTGFALLGASVTMTAACGGHGPNTYLMPKDAVVAKLMGAEREYTFGGKDKKSIRATSRSGDTIKVSVTNHTGPLGTQYCEARVEAVDSEWTRVTPVCPKEGDAVDVTQAEIFEMQVDEFVIAVLYDREVDSAMVLKRTSAVAIDNIGNIAREARDAADAATNNPPPSTFSSYDNDSDWGSDTPSSGDWGD